MKKSILAIVTAFAIAFTMLSSVLIVSAAPFTPSDYVSPVGTTSYNPVRTDWISLPSSSYKQIAVDSNNTPLTYADIMNGTTIVIYGKLRNNGTYGYKLMYGVADTDSLVLVHQDNSQVSSGSTVLGVAWTLDSAALSNITEVTNGGFYLTSSGSGGGECCITGDLVAASVPVAELMANNTITGDNGEFYKLVDVSYEDILNGDSTVTFTVGTGALLVYTSSTDGSSLGIYESVATLTAGTFTLNNENAPSVTISDGYLAVYFASSSTFVYRLNSSTPGFIAGIISDIGEFFSDFADSIGDTISGAFTSALNTLKQWLHIDWIDDLIDSAGDLGDDIDDPGRLDGDDEDYTDIYSRFKDVLGWGD